MAGWAFGEGPRDKLLERGAAALSDGELLALLLNTGYRDCSALDMARTEGVCRGCAHQSRRNTTLPPIPLGESQCRSVHLPVSG